MPDNDDHAPLVAPQEEPTRLLARSVAENIVEVLPGGSFITSLYRVTHAPKSEKARQQWEEAITARANEHNEQMDRHESLLMPTEVIEGLAAQLIIKLLQDCPDGQGRKHCELKDLGEFFPSEVPQSLEDAVLDLKALDLLKTRDWIGGWSVALSDHSYEQLDKHAMGWWTIADAIAIAKIMLEKDSGHAPELHQETGWSKRRFNPAFRHLLPLFPEGRVREVIQPDYPSLGVVLTSEDRATLRRWISKAGEHLGGAADPAP